MKEFIEKLIGRLEEKLKEPLYQHEGEDYYVGICSAQEIVNQLSEEYKGTISKTENVGWIPCSDRLPEGKESHKVLVTDENGIMAVCYFLEVAKIFKVCWDREEFQGVVTWQPLPAPYQPKGE